MGICWYCHWGWAKPVADIYLRAVEALDGYQDVLEYGPAHIVWSDENFEDRHIRWCLENGFRDCEYSQRDQDIVRKSLIDLLAVPEHIRCCVPEDYDCQHPELFPPPTGIEMRFGLH